MLKILPVFDYKRRFSKERESVYTVCLPNNMFIIWSFEPDKQCCLAVTS